MHRDGKNVPERRPPDEDEALLARIRQRPDAIRQFYRSYFPRVYAYVAYRVSTRQDAEDLTSDIFIKLVESIGRFEYRGPGSLAAWVFRIALNTVNQFYRVDQRLDVTLLDALPELDSGELLPDEALTRQQQFTQLHAAIAALTPRRREIVTLRFFGGLRNQEIASVLGLDERTVASHLCRALEDLQHKVREIEVADE